MKALVLAKKEVRIIEELRFHIIVAFSSHVIIVPEPNAGIIACFF